MLTIRKSALLPERVERRNISLSASDGTILRGWYLAPTPTPAKRIILYCYGNNENVQRIQSRLYNIVALQQCNVVCVDYRGFGMSDGAANLQSILSDMNSVYDWVRDSLKQGQHIVVFGHSLGSGIALHLATQRKVSGLCLQAALLSAEAVVELVQQRLPWYAKLFVRLQADSTLQMFPKPINMIRTLDATLPLLVLHSVDDDEIPMTMGRQIFELASTRNKHWCAVPNAKHDVPIEVSPAKDSLSSFLQRYFD